jgi:hypothetical protein
MRGKWRECSADMEVKSLIGFWGDLAARRSYLYGVFRNQKMSQKIVT